MLKGNSVLTLCFLMFNFSYGQTNRLDCLRGNYNTYKKGLIVVDAMERGSVDAVKKLPRKEGQNIKYEDIFLRFQKLYKNQKPPMRKVRFEMIEVFAGDDSCYYERTYYRILKSKIQYTFQTRTYFDSEGNLEKIEIFEQSKAVIRDAIIKEKLKNKTDIPFPPMFPGK